MELKNFNDRSMYFPRENEDRLRDILHDFPSNDNKKIVTMKIALIDSLYSTNLSKQQRKITISKIADLFVDSPHFDKRIQSGDIKIADEFINKLEEISGVRLLSFISKYLSLHNYYCYGRQDFMIYDQLVSQELKFLGAKIRSKTSYMDYLNAVNQLLAENERNNLPDNFRELDYFLWTRGKKGQEKKP